MTSRNTDTSHPYLQVSNVTKTFGSFVALADISLEISKGEFVCFLGPSGCGKTTLLRIIAGLEEHNAGQIIQNGVDISRLPPAKRDFGIVFQSYALFPNLTAAQNIAYGLENSRVPKKEVHQRVHELLTLVGLPDAGYKYPAQLSGGQQQRIALARALALSPGLLLLDEPLSALDAKVRAALRSEITRLHQRLGLTTIMVTHDQEEALTMADRIVVMDQGSIVQVGTPLEVYRQPVSSFVASFVGIMNFLPAVVSDQPGHIRCGDFLLDVSHRLNGATPGTPLRIAIRPEDVCVLPEHEATPDTRSGQVETAEFLGPFYRLHLRIPTTSSATNGHSQDIRLVADLAAGMAHHLALKENALLPVRLPTDAIQLFPSES